MELIPKGNYEVVVESVEEKFNIKQSKVYFVAKCILTKRPYEGDRLYYFMFNNDQLNDFFHICEITDQHIIGDVVYGKLPVDKKLIAEITISETNLYPNLYPN